MVIFVKVGKEKAGRGGKGRGYSRQRNNLNKGLEVKMSIVWSRDMFSCDITCKPYSRYFLYALIKHRFGYLERWTHDR